jgi:hypothetical protein
VGNLPMKREKGKDGIYWMEKPGGERTLVISFPKGKNPVHRQNFKGKLISENNSQGILACPYSHTNASALRKAFPWTSPRVLGVKPAFGMGYRPSWGLGNVAQALLAKELGVTVMLAQQSAREIERTGRTFADVLDRATWSAFEARLKIPWGADADHLKTEEQVREAVSAEYTYFTYDPSPEIENKADCLEARELEGAFRRTIPDEEGKRLLREYCGQPLNIPPLSYNFSRNEIMRIGVKYYRALEKVFKLYRLTEDLKGKEPFDAEISVDETEKETTPLEQVFISNELKGRGVQLVGLAPRFPGYFEKAIDYYSQKDLQTGKKRKDPGSFEKRLEEIVLIARHFGYKVSVHSGSDKFLIYPLLGEIAKGIFHLKTAGTSYVEEMKVIARNEPDLFREVYAFARGEFERERASYELSTNLDHIPDLSGLKGEEIANLLESGPGNDDLRQLIHVTYGSVLSRFGERLGKILRENEEELFRTLKNHLKRHLRFLGLG